MVTFDTTIVRAFRRDHSYNSSALEDAEKLKYDKYLDPYARACGLAFVPLASTSIGQLGADLLRVLWVCALLAVGRAEAKGLMARFLLRRMALAPMCWRRRRDGASCFRR